MDAFYWVIDWEGMISVSSLVGLLEKHFFPKWLQVHPALLWFWGGLWGQGGGSGMEAGRITLNFLPRGLIPG